MFNVYPIDTQPAHDVLGTSPEGPVKILTSRTDRAFLHGTNTKIDDLKKKLISRRNSPCITYLFLLFTGRKNIQKF